MSGAVCSYGVHLATTTKSSTALLALLGGFALRLLSLLRLLRILLGLLGIQLGVLLRLLGVQLGILFGLLGILLRTLLRLLRLGKQHGRESGGKPVADACVPPALQPSSAP